MIINISDEEFKRIFEDTQFHLPLRWHNIDFADTLRLLFDTYLFRLEQCDMYSNRYESVSYDNSEIYAVCSLLVSVVRHYSNGFPSKAFCTFKKLMRILERTPLKTYEKSIKEQFAIRNYRDSLNLYRVTCVNDNTPYGRKRVFHTPYYLRSKVSTNRYSIAGFPSLYLGTSLELCCEEVHYNPHEQFALASKFQIERNYEYNNTEIKVIELAIKPQDFLTEENHNDFYKKTRLFPEGLLNKASLRSAYLLWYPLIAACSFIRVNKKDPFAAEYIIPQLLMQWVRLQLGSSSKENRQLIGIRYFSCASEKASDMGFNYVFPASGAQTDNSFCPILTDAFKLTRPYYIHEYNDIYACEMALKNDDHLSGVDE